MKYFQLGILCYYLIWNMRRQITFFINSAYISNTYYRTLTLWQAKNYKQLPRAHVLSYMGMHVHIHVL